jgi:UDP-N-acetylmuramate--alanine ligase
MAARARPGDLVVTMGAGDVSMVGPEVLAALREPVEGLAELGLAADGDGPEPIR